MTDQTTNPLDEIAELPASLEAAKTVMNITAKSIKFNTVGDTFRGYFIGLRPWIHPDEETGALIETPVAYFFEPVKKEIRFNMGASLTRQMKEAHIGHAFEIKFTEEVKNKKKGKTKCYDVLPLNAPTLNGTLKLLAASRSTMRQSL